MVIGDGYGRLNRRRAADCPARPGSGPGRVRRTRIKQRGLLVLKKCLLKKGLEHQPRRGVVD